MNVELKMKAICAGKNVQTGSDGKTEFYSLAVVQNGQAGNLSCGKEVFESVLSEGQMMDVYDFTCVYRDGQYKNLKIVHAGKSDSNGAAAGGSSQSTASRDKNK